MAKTQELRGASSPWPPPGKTKNKQKAKKSVPKEPSKWVFKRLKSMSFGGLCPLDPHQGRCPWTPPGALKRAPGPHAVMGERSARYASLATLRNYFLFFLNNQVASLKKEARKKGKRGKNWEEKKENCKKELGKLEMEVGNIIKRGEDLFFFFCFSLLKMTEICFRSTKMGIFYREKNQEKWLCPLRKICLLRPCVHRSG